MSAQVSRGTAGLRWSTLLLLLTVACAAGWRWWRAHPMHVTSPAAAMAGEPKIMLWAWETPEDVTALDPSRTGVAFLSRELLLGGPGPAKANATQVRILPRMQPLRVAPGTWLMAVVRIERTPGTALSMASAQDVAQNIIAAAGEPNVRGLQIDFDALASERAFYAQVLRDVRARLPAGMPLSMTALASWCGPESWLRGLPVDEAVPMFFRMGGPASQRAAAPRDFSSIIEPLCASSVGIATDETWPAISPVQRVYVFRSGAWTVKEIARVNAMGYEGLRGSVLP